MKVFISYTKQDKKYADLIAARLREDGHDVWYDAWSLKVGDNLVEKINQGLWETDALIMIVSNNSLRSKWVMHEFAAFAFGELSGKNSRIIPVLVDKSTVPEYLARYVYVDISENTELGLSSISHALIEEPAARAKAKSERTRSYENAVNALSNALYAGRLTLVCGAGVSISAGIPSWNSLLLRLLKSMMFRISQDHSIPLDGVDPLEFQKRYGPSALIVGKYLKLNLGNDFMPELRNALYSDNPTSCDLIEAIVEMARPKRDGRPLNSILTFNFDDLIEENLANNNIRHKSIYAEGMRDAPNELPIYHVHGYLPRKGKIKMYSDLVFSEDAYHSQFTDPFSWSNLIQLSKLSQDTCLFLGLSLSDPNLRRLLDVAHRKNPSSRLNHYIIRQTPGVSGYNDTVDDLALLLEEQDANELGLNAVWIKEFCEIAPLLRRIVREI